MTTTSTYFGSVLLGAAAVYFGLYGANPVSVLFIAVCVMSMLLPVLMGTRRKVALVRMGGAVAGALLMGLLAWRISTPIGQAAVGSRANEESVSKLLQMQAESHIATLKIEAKRNQAQSH
jgi:hypothetical protein